MYGPTTLSASLLFVLAAACDSPGSSGAGDDVVADPPDVLGISVTFEGDERAFTSHIEAPYDEQFVYIAARVENSDETLSLNLDLGTQPGTYDCTGMAFGVVWFSPAHEMHQATTCTITLERRATSVGEHHVGRFQATLSSSEDPDAAPITLTEGRFDVKTTAF